MSNKAVKWEELTLDTALDLAEKRGIVIFPVATAEAHGNHLPLGTDTFTAEWIGEELSKKTGIPVLSPTPIRAGTSPTFHYDLNGDPLPGTLAVSQSTMHNLIKDILRGLWSAGFRKIIIIQGHGQEPNFQVFDIAQIIPIADPGHKSTGGIGTPEQIKSATAEKGRKVLTRAVERYLDLIRDLERYYAPNEVPGVDIKVRPEQPRFKVDY